MANLVLPTYYILWNIFIGSLHWILSSDNAEKTDF